MATEWTFFAGPGPPDGGRVHRSASPADHLVPGEWLHGSVPRFPGEKNDV